MTKDIYFFDSYALIEVVNGNENYKKYEDSIVVTTKLNLFEVFYSLLRDLREEDAILFLENYYEAITDFNKEEIKTAAKFRLENKRKNISMTDSIGYIVANKWGIRFLTGDKEFENLPNVEFIK